MAIKINFYCPACGEESIVRFDGHIGPAAEWYIKCPNCATRWVVTLEYKEQGDADMASARGI